MVEQCIVTMGSISAQPVPWHTATITKFIAYGLDVVQCRQPCRYLEKYAIKKTLTAQFYPLIMAQPSRSPTHMRAR